MSELNKKYHAILSELDKNIQDTNALNRIKGNLSELVIYFTDMINKFIEMEKRIEKTERNLRSTQKRIDSIEQDIYVDSDSEFDDFNEFGFDQMHDNDYEFEITCPYCNFEFITDDSNKNQNSIKCPKCKKTIELDWNIDESCYGNCNSCGSHCYYDEDESEAHEKIAAEDNDDYSVDVKPPKEKGKNKEKPKDNNNDDDM